MKRHIRDLLATIAVTCALLASCDKPKVDVSDHSIPPSTFNCLELP